MRFTIRNKIIGITLGGLCLALDNSLVAQVGGSLKNLGLEQGGNAKTVADLLEENTQLRAKLLGASDTISSLQKNFATIATEAEVFRRKAAELSARLEALGTAQIDTRLVKLLNELKLASDDRSKMRDALIELTESVSRYGKNSVGHDPVAGLELEAIIRESGKLLGIASSDIAGPAGITPAISDSMVVGVKDELALIVANVGTRHGVRVGMPFHIVRNEIVIASVRIVDVREKIAGALVQNLSDKETIKVGDRLKVAIRP